MSTENNQSSLCIQYTDMTTKDQEFSIETCLNSLKLQDKTDKTVYFKDIAKAIKVEFDGKLGGTWNVVIGESFGSFVTNETKT